MTTSTLPREPTSARSGHQQPHSTPAGGRLRLALNVSDIDAAVEFCATLSDAQPAKRRPGYANVAVAQPRLKLVLIESSDARESGVSGALNHLGVEVADPAEVTAASRRLTGEGLETLTRDAATCCFAVQDKVWVHDPDGAPWEAYTVPADAPAASGLRGDGQCCATDASGPDVDPGPSGVPVAATSARS
jgi:catechol 2,3-dioxygenase-like lactoylglutathione lyase family enzyme